MTQNLKGPVEIAAYVAGEEENIAKLLVLAVRRDGSSFSLDNGLTADEAKTMAIHFHSWVDRCLGMEEDGS
jgi:hypothetical protein